MLSKIKISLSLDKMEIGEIRLIKITSTGQNIPKKTSTCFTQFYDIHYAYQKHTIEILDLVPNGRDKSPRLSLKAQSRCGY